MSESLIALIAGAIRGAAHQQHAPRRRPARPNERHVSSARRDSHSRDRWSDEYQRSFGAMPTASSSTAAKPRVTTRPGSAPNKSTVFLGSGLRYDKAEAARLARAERDGLPPEAAYPLARGQVFERRPWVQWEGRSWDGATRVVFQAPAPVVVNIREGGLPAGL